MSVGELKEENVLLRRRSLLHTISFLLGFSVVFVVLGMSTTYIYSLFVQNMDLIRQIGAIIIIFFGLMTVGLIQPKSLMSEKRIEFKNKPSGYIGSALVD